MWSDTSLTEDVRDEVLRALQASYAHAAPEFVYFKTLLHLFDDFLTGQAAEGALIQQTAIWRTMFDFQPDGLRAVLAKIEKHGGCILVILEKWPRAFRRFGRSRSVMYLIPSLAM